MRARPLSPARDLACSSAGRLRTTLGIRIGGRVHPRQRVDRALVDVGGGHFVDQLGALRPARVLFDQRARYRLGRPRSEEHTSELQSLMRTSYAVFCLKKKKYSIYWHAKRYYH